jgi:SSS family solute:Na+ symporter
VFALTGTALCLAIFFPSMLVNLLLTGYSGVTQFFPMIVFGLFWKRSTLAGAFSGLIIGEFLVFYMILNKMDPWAIAGLHLNAGFVALAVNLCVFLVVSMMTYKPENDAKRAEILVKS